MASPAQVPPPRPRRSLAGPVVLIVLGIVFLLGTMGVLHFYMLGHWFARYWPLLIILWGVVKLLEYQQAQREGRRAPGIGAGGIFLLVVLIVFGLAATQASRFNWEAIGKEIDIDDEDFSFFGHSYSFDDQLAQAFPVGATLRVTDIRGAVNVNVSDDNQIRVVVHKRIKAESQQDADKWNAGTKPQITVNDHTVLLNANNDGAGDHWVAIDMDISIPRKASVAISTRRGDVSVMGRDGDVDVSTQHGDVTASDINGKVSVNLTHGSARVSQVASDVSVEGRGGDITVGEVKGTLRLNGEFDSLKLSKIANTVNFRSERTDMELSKLNGDLDMDSGDMRASDVIGPLRLSTRHKDIRLEGMAGDVRLKDENGSVEVRMSKLGSMQVENRRGDIQIYVPDKAGFQLEAKARGGEVESDFGELKINNASDQATATGTVGGGGPHLVINNEHGTIEIRKGSALAEAPPAPPASPKAPRAPAAPKSPAVTEN
ncbi:MAG TPA: DUF4097 family beta strand repeat-containing protein [Terriglobales bacterium]|nr:DUF4097 family beta strand repeat-containing protein [Terriglobales bacterium]